ncbi:desmethyl-deoxy-podophyllotoxin synthase-like [Syzygium oleosum]|uniref:desmethyl-deoxy-podophyllotoxin synthase-like n=1 Tax=Syzygium oleosum TaxID=219896 RepID=UPI0011D1D7F0|nr:desmethyl-deoxy-podophyllotoxin synthase-like [Syzygium oleosum]XP_056177542.1 desmethyl-deoxy-podophyllotoxin synthase-like [Syzygium oleosum]
MLLAPASMPIINAWALRRDPDRWNDVECFLSERYENSSVTYKETNFEYIPSGAGRRMCPSILFGLANIELPLAQLLCHFHWKPEELDMTVEFGATARKKNDLNLLPSYNIPSQSIGSIIKDYYALYVLVKEDLGITDTIRHSYCE